MRVKAEMTKSEAELPDKAEKSEGRRRDLESDRKEEDKGSLSRVLVDLQTEVHECRTTVLYTRVRRRYSK